MDEPPSESSFVHDRDILIKHIISSNSFVKKKTEYLN